MHTTFRLLAASTFLLAAAQMALAVDDLPPDCPGGGTATGKPSCTGPIFKPVCTEGPPWTCTLKDDKKTAELDRGPAKPPRFVFPVESLSSGGSDSGGVYDPGIGGGGNFGGTTGSPATTATTGGGGPSFL